MNNTRRAFQMTVAASGAVLTSAAHTQAKLDEKDARAVALCYVAEATKTDNQPDTQRFPNCAAGQVCTDCALYQGKPADTWRGCPWFFGKQVAGKGWCGACQVGLTMHKLLTLPDGGDVDTPAGRIVGAVTVCRHV